MKNKILAVSVVALLVLGTVCAMQWRQLESLKQQLAAAQQTQRVQAEAHAAQSDKIKQLETQRARLGQDVDQFTSLVTAMRAKESSYASNFARLNAGNASTNGGESNAGESEKGGVSAFKGMGGMLSKMMKDPAMREMMRSQQKMMFQKMYGPLIKELNLTPEQKERFSDLILDSQMSAIDQAGALFKEGEADKAEAAKVLKEKQASLDADLKSLLGEEKYGEYKELSKTMGERMQLDQFRQQLEDGNAALQDDQVKSLLQLMKEEREKVPPVISNKPNGNPADLNQALNEETMAKQFQWQEDLNKRVQERAGQILTPEQLKEFVDFQTQQANMQKMGMKMAREMFGAGKAETTPNVQVTAPPAK